MPDPIEPTGDDVATFTAPGADDRPPTAPEPLPAHQPRPLDLDAELGPEGELVGGDREAPLDAVVAELTTPPEGETFLRSIPIPNRPGWTLVVNIDFPHEDLRGWRKRCTTKPEKVTPSGTKPAVIDELRLAATIVAARTVELRRHGVRIMAGGEPAAFTNPAFLSELGVERAINAVSRIYASDAHVLRAGARIVDEAGYGDDLDAGDDEDDFAPDPTTRGSRDF